MPLLKLYKTVFGKNQRHNRKIIRRENGAIAITETIAAQKIKLADLKEQFNLQYTEDESVFSECQESLSPLNEIKQQTIIMQNSNYPFARALITDTDGNIQKVILNYQDYTYLLELLEDQELYHAMLPTLSETPLNREQALKILEEE
ncbi:MAG: hypothetical protein AAGA60_19565 [Cyanobacteria bacterium P01_E01_bin.42]